MPAELHRVKHGTYRKNEGRMTQINRQTECGSKQGTWTLVLSILWTACLDEVSESSDAVPDGRSEYFHVSWR